MSAYRRRQAAQLVAMLGCTLLQGCGIVAINHEAKRYRAEVSTATERELSECLAHSSAEVRHRLDHRLPGAAGPDCYAAFTTPSSRQLLERSAAQRGPVTEAAEKDSTKPRSAPARIAGAAVAVLEPQQLADKTSAADVLGQVAWPAMLSKIVYRRFVSFELRSDSETACGLESALHPLNRLNAAAASGQGRWEPWHMTGIGCAAVDGLFYETFVYRGADGMVSDAFIVFRGTENYRGQFVGDWATNMAMAFNRPPRQFGHVKERLKGLLDALVADAPAIRIYAAGHSLGGSLAQLAAYLDERVLAAYAFNTSPVSGWTWLRGLQASDPSMKLVADPKIIRVLQEGEFLSFVRGFSNAANTTIRRSNRIDVALDFPASRAILEKTDVDGMARTGGALHSITWLACNLASRVADGAPGAFGFTKAMADALVKERDKTFVQKGGRQTEGVCEVATETLDCDVDWTGGTAVCKPVEKDKRGQLRG